jgi:hypothetical protein
MRLAALAIVALLPFPAASQDVRFTANQRLEFPSDYREWIFLSSGHGMTYGPSADPHGPPLFDNVFVNPAAYRHFVKTGRWPEQAIFILEVRHGKTEGSINKGGQFQTGISGLEVLVKDTKRFADTEGWGFFEFDEKRQPAAKLPKTATCYACHSKNGAVEHTFVQFYPTLLPIATAHKTMKTPPAAH